MTELIRSIATGINAFAGAHLTAPRRKARLPINVKLFYLKEMTTPPPMLAFEGYTQDISATGLGIILPFVCFSELLLNYGNGMLQIVFDLASGPIAIHAEPVRYESLYLDNQEVGRGCLIGARITEMSKRDRKRFSEYLRSLC